MSSETFHLQILCSEPCPLIQRKCILVWADLKQKEQHCFKLVKLKRPRATMYLWLVFWLHPMWYPCWMVADTDRFSCSWWFYKAIGTLTKLQVQHLTHKTSAWFPASWATLDRNHDLHCLVLSWKSLWKWRKFDSLYVVENTLTWTLCWPLEAFDSDSPKVTEFRQ